MIAGAVLDGISAEMAGSGADLGAQAELPVEALPEVEMPGAEAAPAPAPSGEAEQPAA